MTDKKKPEVTTKKPADGPGESKLFKTTTLKEFGPNFPVIRRDSEGKTIEKRGFTFNEWDMEMEETLSKMKGQAESTGKFVNDMMGTMFADFCGTDFQSLDDETRQLRINQLEFPNVMYAYIHLRVQELGPEMKIDVGCPACGKLNKDFTFSLEDMDVRVKDADHPRTVLYELKRPIILEDKQIITGVTLDVAKWDAMERADVEVRVNSAKMKWLLFESAIAGVNNAKGPLPPDEFVDIKTVIKKLKKVDIELCMAKLVENNGGPLMATSGKCHYCKTEFWKELDWRFDYFFDSSSL